MSEKARVQISRVGKGEEYLPKGMKVSKWTFRCDGHIDGEAATDFIVIAWGKKSEYIQPGFDFLADVDVFHGKTQYVVPKDMSAPSRSNPPPRSEPPAQSRASAPTSANGKAQASGSGGGAYAQHASYTMSEYDALFRHAMDTVIALIPAREGEGVEADPVSRLVSTYMISAISLGVKVQAETANEKHEAKPPVDFAMLIEILENKGLAKRVDEANISEDDLINMWTASGENKLKFGMLVNEALKASEQRGADAGNDGSSSAGDDNLPF